MRFSQLEISRRLCSICSSAEPIHILTSHSEACARKPPVPKLEGIGDERFCVRCVAPTQTSRRASCDSNPLVCSRSWLPRARAKYINLTTGTNSVQGFRCCCCFFHRRETAIIWNRNITLQKAQRLKLKVLH